MNGFKLPPNLLLGAATAATQIESGIIHNNWYPWAKIKKNKDGSDCSKTADHWEHLDEDIQLMSDINLQTYRFSVEWSRIEPQEGIFDDEAINRYRYEVEQLKQRGIIPLVTLHHFSNPLWFDNLGGWMNENATKYFVRFSEYVVNHLGDLISDWCTLNEPNGYLFTGFIMGYWPPGEKGQIQKFFRGAKIMINSHIEVYKLIHKLRTEMGFNDSKVGYALHFRCFEGKDETPFEKFICGQYAYYFHDIFVRGMSEGVMLPPLGAGVGNGNKLFIDYLGINYYTRDIIKFVFNFKSFFGQLEVDFDSKKTDMGWSIYPNGLFKTCQSLYPKYKIPIFITENGIADKRDLHRCKFIYDHLYEIKKLKRDGINIERYYYWSLMDNFEWMEGLKPRFGLIEIDYKTMQRKLRKSAFFFSDIIKNKAITQEMIKKYKV